MGTDHRSALRSAYVLLLGVVAADCSKHQPSGGGASPRSPEQGQNAGMAGTAGDATSASGASGGAAGSPTPMASGGAPTSMAGAPTSIASGGVAAGSAGSSTDPASAGMAGEPPLVVNPVEVWGGKPLDMVPYATSGSRLAAVGYADDGAVFFGTMRDTLFGTDCRFELTATADWVCSPTRKRPMIYLDAACTEPAVEMPPFSTPTGELFGFQDGLESSSGGSDTTLVTKHEAVYRIADAAFESNGESPYAEEVMSIYTRFGQQCSGPRQVNRHVVVTPPSVFRVTPVADSELVTATVRQVPLKNGLTLERLVTADGAQLSGNLTLAGRACELERDGRCVPEPVAKRYGYAEAECNEWAFGLPSGAGAGVTLYGAEPDLDETTKVYGLSAVSTIYARLTRVDMVPVDGGTMAVEVVIGCESEDVSADTASVHYRRMVDVTEQFPKLDTVQLGSAELSPIWFFGELADSDTRIQVQIHSPEGNWVKPNIRTKNGSVCSVYDERYENQCLMMDGLSSLPVTEVSL